MDNTPQDELLAIADREGRLSTAFDDPSIKDPIDAVQAAAEKIGKAWSGSWLGYQSHVYYRGLVPVPAGAHFSSEWGFENMGWVDGATTGDWEEFTGDQIKTYISELSHNSGLDLARGLVARIARQFESDKSEVASLLSVELSRSSDSYVESLKEELDKLRLLSKSGVVKVLRPSGQIMSRDSLAATQGLRVPPHLEVLAEVYALHQSKQVCEQLSTLARKAGSHIGRKSRRPRAEPTENAAGPDKSVDNRKIFIVHGHDEAARETVARFLAGIGFEPIILHERPNKGRTLITKFREEAAGVGFAVVLMTPDDHGGKAEELNTKPRARQNVIFELGFLIGALGPSRVAALVRQDIEHPSDFDGVVYIDLDPAGGWKLKLVKELKEAGFEIDGEKVMRA